jgi:hypothetical protein
MHTNSFNFYVRIEGFPRWSIWATYGGIEIIKMSDVSGQLTDFFGVHSGHFDIPRIIYNEQAYGSPWKPQVLYTYVEYIFSNLATERQCLVTLPERLQLE